MISKKLFFQVAHHLVAHPLVALTAGRLWAWRFHDWTASAAWPCEDHAPPRQNPGIG